MIKLTDLMQVALGEAKKKQIKECAGCDSEQSQDWTHGHDHEGSMAKSEVKGMIKNAVQLHNLLGKNDELPGWISAYITLASDYMNSITQYLLNKASEEDMPETEVEPQAMVMESHKHKIIAQLMGPDFYLSQKNENDWDEKDHDLFNRIMKMASEEGKVPTMKTTA